MHIPFNQPSRNSQRHRAGFDAAIAQFIDSGRYILGPAVSDFEHAFAEFCGAKHCIGVANGTDALLLALLAADIGAGDEVITVANAGGYSSGVCFRLGAVPVYIDVADNTLLVDPHMLKTALSDKTRAIIVTHLYGNVVPMPAFQQFAERHNLLLIEDCAQAHGAAWQGQTVGTWGAMGTFSFYPTKNLGALGDAGALVCQDQGLAEKIRELHQYGWQSKYSVQRAHGINSRLDALQASLLQFKLPFLQEDNQRRQSIAARYQSALANTQAQWLIDTNSVAHLAVLRHSQRDQLRAMLQTAGIGCDIHYPILDCDQAGWRELTWRSLTLPVSRQACEEILTIPLYPELEDDEVDYIIEHLGQALHALDNR